MPRRAEPEHVGLGRRTAHPASPDRSTAHRPALPSLVPSDLVISLLAFGPKPGRCFRMVQSVGIFPTVVNLQPLGPTPLP